MAATISGTTGGIGLVGSATAQNSTSGTSIDFTGIPAGAKRITVMFNGVSTSGTSAVQIQLGTSSGAVASGYLGSYFEVASGTAAGGNLSSGFVLSSATLNTAASLRHGVATFVNVTGNTWAAQGTFSMSNTIDTNGFSGSIVLAALLDRVRITTVNGTDTFDAGSINILYE